MTVYEANEFFSQFACICHAKYLYVVNEVIIWLIMKHTVTKKLKLSTQNLVQINVSFAFFQLSINSWVFDMKTTAAGWTVGVESEGKF